MKEIKRFQVRGIPGKVTRAEFSGRIVDFWAPQGGSDHVLIAHDGQNIFDRKTATFLYTWKLTQTSIRIAKEAKKNPPLIIGVFHSSNKSDPHGRGKDLCPEDAFRDGIEPASKPDFNVDELRGNKYLSQIFDDIAPRIAQFTNSNYRPEKTAMIGSSMGGLATLYAAIKHSDRFHTALALSPHWVLAGNPLVDWMVPKLPKLERFKLWMSRGTKGLDATYAELQNYANTLMIDREGKSTNFTSKVFNGLSHNERSWSRIVGEPLKFWLE